VGAYGGDVLGVSITTKGSSTLVVAWVAAVPHTYTGRQPLTRVWGGGGFWVQRRQQQQQQQQYGGVREQDAAQQDAAQPRLEPGPDGGARWTWDDCCSSLSHGLTHCTVCVNEKEDTANSMGAAHWAAYVALLGGFPVRPCLTGLLQPWRSAQRLRVWACAS
jgi:hypothetical protein